MDIHSLVNWIGKVLPDVLNSNFSTSLVGAAAGAIGGALASQYIVEREKRRQRTIDEISNINKCVLILSGIFTHALLFKKEQVLDVLTNYRMVYQDLLLFEEQRRLKQISPDQAIKVPLDLRALEPFSEPVSFLSDTIVGQIDVDGKTIQALKALTQSVSQLSYAISERNNLISNLLA
jgi:hypothetical protein